MHGKALCQTADVSSFQNCPACKTVYFHVSWAIEVFVSTEVVVLGAGGARPLRGPPGSIPVLGTWAGYPLLPEISSQVTSQGDFLGLFAQLEFCLSPQN